MISDILFHFETAEAKFEPIWIYKLKHLSEDWVATCPLTHLYDLTDRYLV